jgi:hypothetical protein
VSVLITTALTENQYFLVWEAMKTDKLSLDA